MRTNRRRAAIADLQNRGASRRLPWLLLTFSRPPRSVAIVNWGWTKSPPLMQRTLTDDLKWALFVLIGVTLGYLVIGSGETSLLFGSIAGVVLVIVVLNILRR